MNEGFHMTGADQLIRRVDAYGGKLARNRSRAARAAANLLKVVMREQAPFTPAGQRDVGRKKAKVRHLRASINVRAETHGGFLVFSGPAVEAFSVGPRTGLAHLVVRGARRGQTETVGGVGQDAHQETLRLRREMRMHGRHLAGPYFGNARALSWQAGGERLYAHSVQTGPMPANDFISRTRAIASGEARTIAGEVLFHEAIDANEGA